MALGAVLSCRAARPDAALPVKAPPVAARALDAGFYPLLAGEACAKITEANAAQVKAAREDVNRRIALEPKDRGLTPLERDPDDMQNLPPWNACTLVPAGAWGFSIDAITFDLFGSGVTARWSVAFAGRDGHPVRKYEVTGDALMNGTSKDVANANCCSQYGWFTLAPLDTFDFDGDGVDEAFFARTLAFPWQSEEQVGVLLSVTGDSIEPYSGAPETSIFAMVDRNGDARPDLLLHRAPSEECYPDHPEGKCVRIWGPVTALRSERDGTFKEDPTLASE